MRVEMSETTKMRRRELFDGSFFKFEGKLYLACKTDCYTCNAFNFNDEDFEFIPENEYVDYVSACKIIIHVEDEEDLK